MNVVDKLVYGALSNPHEPMRVFITLMNWACNAYFITQCLPSELKLSLLMVTMATLSAYEMEPTAVGASTIWSFYYGFNQHRTAVDHWLYYSYSAVVIPGFLFAPVINKYTGVNIWPWSKDFMLTAVLAHVLFACLGVLIRHLI